MRSSRARIFSNISSRTVFYLSNVSVPVFLFHVDAGTMVSICKLMRIGRWSEHRFVFVFQLVEVDANEQSSW